MPDSIIKPSPIKKIDYLLMLAFVVAVVLALAGAFLTSSFILPR